MTTTNVLGRAVWAGRDLDLSPFRIVCSTQVTFADDPATAAGDTAVPEEDKHPVHNDPEEG